MGGPLIGNQNRRGGSSALMGPTSDIRTGYGTVGWGVTNVNLTGIVKRNVIIE